MYRLPGLQVAYMSLCEVPNFSRQYNKVIFQQLLHFAESLGPNPLLQQYRLLFPLVCRGVLLLAAYGTTKVLVRALAWHCGSCIVALACPCRPTNGLDAHQCMHGMSADLEFRRGQPAALAEYMDCPTAASMFPGLH